jgi:ribonuclease J
MHELDGCGPLHVSGHASIEEYRDMINMTKPKFFIPIYGPFRSKRRHIEIAVEQGIPRANSVNAENGDVITLLPDKIAIEGKVPHGTTLVDQTGSLVSGVVVKDRIMLAEEGMVAVVLTIDRKSGALLTSPDILTRGFIYIRDSEELMNGLRVELRRAVQQRFKRIDLDRFKQELKDHVTHYLYEQTQRSPIVIPVVNIIGGGKPGGNGNNGNNSNDKSQQRNNQNPQNSGENNAAPKEESKSPEQLAEDQQKRFAQLRAKLLNQDARTD